MSRKSTQKPGFRRWPYRGMWVEIADYLSRKGGEVTADVVRMRYVRGNPTVKRLVDREVARRTSLLEGRNA